MKQKYIDNYHALKNLPIVQKLILKNKQLKKENKNLRNALSLLGEVKCKTICKYSNDNSDIISIYSDDTEENITYSVEKKTDVITNKKTDVITDNNYKNTIIKKENSSDDEPTIVGDISPRCWSLHNSRQNLKEEEEELKKNEIINRIKEEKKIKKEKELIVQFEEVRKRKEALKQEERKE